MSGTLDLPSAADATALLASDVFPALSGAILPLGVTGHELWAESEDDDEDREELGSFR